MIFLVLLNEWGGGQQLEGVDTLEKGKDQMEPGFGKGQVEDTKEEMARQGLIIENNDEKAPFSLEDTTSVNSQERGLQKKDAKEEMVRNGKNAFSNEIVLDNNGIGKEEVSSSLEETKAVNSQDNKDVESQVRDSKEEMVRDGQEALFEDKEGNWIKCVEKTKREYKEENNL